MPFHAKDALGGASYGNRLAIVLFFISTTLCAGDPPRLIRLTNDGHFKQRPVWSPDGRQLLFARHRAGKIALVVIPAAGTGEQVITKGDLPQYDGCWSPDSKRLALTYVKQSSTQGDLDVYTCALDGTDLQPFAVNRGKLSHEESPAWSPDGKRIAFTSTADNNQELYSANRDGGDLVRLTHDPAIDCHPAWSPDSTRIVFSTARWGDLELAVMSADGASIMRLTESRGIDDYPVWSPDGKRIAFTSNRDGNFEIYVMNADGSGPVNVSQHEAVDNFAAWSPDGGLTFASNRDGGFDLYRTATVP